mgnify:CR=1 FL=1
MIWHRAATFAALFLFLFGPLARAQDITLTSRDGAVEITGTLLGSPAYMAPEIITKEGLYPASDLYALGVILYEAMVGEPPFYEKDAIGTMYRHIHEAPKRLREVDPGLDIPGALETLRGFLLGSIDDEDINDPLDPGGGGPGGGQNETQPCSEMSAFSRHGTFSIQKAFRAFQG